MRIIDTIFDPSPLEPSIDFVFRDFERSKIQRLRGILAADRGLYTFIYLSVAVFWTIMMSYGAATRGNSDFAVNLAPHVAFYTLIIGIMLYPRKRMWIPVSAFSLVFFLPFLVHSATGKAWVNWAISHPDLVLVTFAGHIISGIAIAAIALKLARLAQTFSPDFSVDLLTVVALCATFIVVCAGQNWLFWQASAGIAPLDRLALGFDGEFFAASGERVLRGGVVVAAFLLGVLEVPDRNSLMRGIAFAVVFPALAVMQELGFGFHSTLDVCLVALTVVVMLPTPVGVSACIIGIPVHSALTGAFLSTTHLSDPTSMAIERFSIGLLFLIILIPTLRIPLQHRLRLREASLRRMSMVRDFANVGLLSFNLDRQMFRTDASARRILDLPALGSIAAFSALFDQAGQKDLATALSGTDGHSVNLLLHGDNRSKASQGGKGKVLRMCLWFETAPSGESVAYGLVLDVSGEHDQERILQETLAELSLRQERQRQLFSIVSHELRTPAAVISMLVDDLDGNLANPKLGKQLHEATEQLMSTLADMRQTVNPTQNLPVTRQAYCPADLADSLRNMFEPKARDQGMTIRLNLTDRARASRYGDCRRVRQALSNLLRNAILHSGAKTVEIGYEGILDEDGQNVSRWSVVDNGRGMPADQIERLFQPFERGAQDPRRHVDGSGLGLYIAKSSIETLSGCIAHFVPPKGGTGFVITVPEPLALPADRAPQKVKKSARPQVYRDLHILLAEDNALVAEVTMAKLSRFVGRVELAVNGRDALEKCRADPPDVLITDLFMPEIDGDDLIAVLRHEGFDAPIVGLTAAAVGDDIERLTQAGATKVMVKPLDISMLESLIRDIGATTRRRRSRNHPVRIGAAANQSDPISLTGSH